MITPRELELQDFIYSKLENYNIYPFSVIYTFGLNKDGLLSITFYLDSDLEEVLNILDYNSLCDKTGFLIFNDNKTIIMSSIGITRFFQKI